MYKAEKQAANAAKLSVLMAEDNAPDWIGKALGRLDSETGKLNRYYLLRSTVHWMIAQGYIPVGTLSEVTVEHLESISIDCWNAWLRHIDAELAASTAESTRAAVSGSLQYLADLEVIRKNPLRSPGIRKKRGARTSRKLDTKLPTEAQVKRLVAAVQDRDDAFLSERNRAIVGVALGTALRESEIAGLDISDVHLDAPHPCVTVLRKGSYAAGDREDVLLTATAIDALERWLQELPLLRFDYGIPDGPALFVTKKGSRIREAEIRSMIQTASDGEITPQMLRHYCLTRLYEQTKDLALVQSQAGHTDVKTTFGFYVHQADDAADKLAGLRI